MEKKMFLLHLEYDSDRLPMLLKKDLGVSPYISQPEDAVKILEEHFAPSRQPEEHVYALFIDSDGAVRGIAETSGGSSNGCVFNTRGIYTRALLCNTPSVLCAHNHPSGSVKPSDIDIETFHRFKEGAKYVELNVVDNLIIGNGFFSFKEEGIA